MKGAGEAVRHEPGNEASLVWAAQQGDRAAFAALVEAYWDRLYRWLYQLTRTAGIAIQQECVPLGV